jgi:MFS family permease
MNRNLILLMIALVTWGVGEGLFFYFQPIYLAELGADPVTIGAILGVAGIAMVTFHIPAGYLADKVGRRPLLRAAWVVGLTSAGFMALGTDLWSFSIGLILYHLTAFVASPLSSYITAARGKLEVGRALTLVSASFNIGAALGPLTGGWLAQNFGLRTIYIAAFGMFVISTVVMFMLQRQPREDHDPENPPPGLLSTPRLLPFLALSVFAMFAMYLPQPLTPNFLRDERGLLLSAIGILGSVGNLGNAAFNVILGSFPVRRGYIAGQILVGAFSFILWQFVGMPWYIAAFFVLGGFRPSRALASAVVRGLVHPSQMGLAFGLTETMNALPMIAAPILAGYLYNWNPASPYPVSLVLLAISISLCLMFFPRTEAPTGEKA